MYEEINHRILGTPNSPDLACLVLLQRTGVLYYKYPLVLEAQDMGASNHHSIYCHPLFPILQLD